MEARKLAAYQRTSRPPLPESLPLYLDTELQKISVAINNIIQVLKDLEERVVALEAP